MHGCPSNGNVLKTFTAHVSRRLHAQLTLFTFRHQLRSLVEWSQPKGLRWSVSDLNNLRSEIWVEWSETKDLSWCRNVATRTAIISATFHIHYPEACNWPDLIHQHVTKLLCHLNHTSVLVQFTCISLSVSHHTSLFFFSVSQLTSHSLIPAGTGPSLASLFQDLVSFHGVFAWRSALPWNLRQDPPLRLF